MSENLAPEVLGTIYFQSSWENSWGHKILRASDPSPDTIPFSEHRPLQRVLDDAFAQSYTRPFEGWLEGILGRFKR